MSKKIILACVALVAFAAFAIPTAASATNSPELVEGSNPPVTVPTGTKIVATNVGNMVLFETGGSTPVLSCTTASITGTLIKNDGSNIEATIESAKIGGTVGTIIGEPEPECTGLFNAGVTTLGLHWCIRSTATMATDEFRVGSGTCPTTGTISFTLQRTKATGGIEDCIYDSTEALKGIGTTGTDLVHFGRTPHNMNGFTRTAGAFPCPASTEIEMTFTIETDTTASNDPIIINS